MPLCSQKKALAILLPSYLLGIFNFAMGQEPSISDDDATVVYQASYFAQYQLLSVSDMLDRIPGINVARQGSGNQGGPGSSQGSSRRGLGLGGDQVLINGRRITGKENEGNSQLSRIPANQVERIEIIRGTSGELDVRGATQLINIVLLEAESRSSIAYEINADHLHDGEIKPGAKLSLSGQNGDLDYLISGETEPRWENRKGFESSFLPNGLPNDTVFRRTITDRQPVTFSSNVGYQFSSSDVAHLNFQYNQNDAPEKLDRVITDYLSSPTNIKSQFEDISNESDFWELGGDYEHTFRSGNRWRGLFIINRNKDDRTRERFNLDENNLKDIFLNTFNQYEEEIFRTSYSLNLTQNQDLEFGIERAKTTLESSLRLGLLSEDSKSSEYGGLTPANSSNAVVQEVRYEGFVIHNWQFNDRMSLESTLIYEESTIAQSGDISKERDFSFIRPKVDYRFDITPSLQLRATIEKDVAQLSFNDFTANIPPIGDDDQNTFAGNPDIRQEQSWRYDLNLEYRFDEDNGVINTNVYYQDLEDLIDRIDVSTSTRLQSANGNIGDGKRHGGSVDSSYRLSSFNLPQLLLTARLELVNGSATDPFLNIERPLQRQGKGSYRYGFRYDMGSRNISYGVNFSGTFDGDQLVYDIDKIEDYYMEDFIMAFLEIQGWGGLIYRFEATNPHEQYRCRVRTRYSGGTIATGSLSEIEDSCSHAGEKYAIKIRGTF